MKGQERTGRKRGCTLKNHLSRPTTRAAFSCSLAPPNPLIPLSVFAPFRDACASLSHCQAAAEECVSLAFIWHSCTGYSWSINTLLQRESSQQRCTASVNVLLRRWRLRLRMWCVCPASPLICSPSSSSPLSSSLPDEINSESVGVARGFCGGAAVRVPQGKRSRKGLRLEDGVWPPSTICHRHGRLCHQPEAHPLQATGVL